MLLWQQLRPATRRLALALSAAQPLRAKALPAPHVRLRCGRARGFVNPNPAIIDILARPLPDFGKAARDVARLANSFDFFRLLSFYTGGLGFYLNNSFTIWVGCRLPADAAC